MAKTWQNLVDEARVLLQDTETDYRHSNEALLAILNRGLQELRRLRPDAFWDEFDDADVVPPVVVDDDTPDTGEVDLDEEFSLDLMFYTPLVYWVTSSAELVEDEFTNDGRAMALQTQFKAMVVAL